MSLKNSLGIDPGTARLEAQRLNHYATPGPTNRQDSHEIFVKPFMSQIIGHPRNRCSISGEARDFWFLQVFSSNPEPTEPLIQCVLWAFS
jgi:hypothetical protein